MKKDQPGSLATGDINSAGGVLQMEAPLDSAKILQAHMGTSTGLNVKLPTPRPRPKNGSPIRDAPAVFRYNATTTTSSENPHITNSLIILPAQVWPIRMER